jgi:hypothetical protein
VGWSRGADIFDPTIEVLLQGLGIKAHFGWVITEPVIEEAAYTLLDKLTGEADWDDVDDSLARFQDVPAVVRAFNRLGWLAPNQYGDDGMSIVSMPCSQCKTPVRVNENGESEEHNVGGDPTDSGPPRCKGSGLQYHWGY